MGNFQQQNTTNLTLNETIERRDKEIYMSNLYGFFLVRYDEEVIIYIISVESYLSTTPPG